MKRTGLVPRSFSEGGFTLIELLVVIAIIALLMAVLLPALNRAREGGKRAVCLNNVKQLNVSWTMYAESNDDRLVNGAPDSGGPCPAGLCSNSYNSAAVAPTAGAWKVMHENEKPWIGMAWITSATCYKPADECAQKCAIRTGALWPFIKQEAAYRCPMGDKEWLITYSIVDSINGKYMWNKDRGGQNSPTALMQKNLQLPHPSERIVFVDEGHLSPGSYGVYSGMGASGGPSSASAAEYWLDPPMSRHGGGVIVSYADGHTARWMWKSKATVSAGAVECNFYWKPPSGDEAALNDLYKMQIATWGKLYYTPTVNVNVETE